MPPQVAVRLTAIRSYARIGRVTALAKRIKMVHSARADYVVDQVDAEGYEPDMVHGAQVGEFDQIEPAGGSRAKLDVYLWRSDPATYEYLFENDEAFHVVARAATVELPDTGDSIDLQAGDLAYFGAGTRSIWTITQPFKKFKVIAK
jgi:uncharacterized cupin superfamily protein